MRDLYYDGIRTLVIEASQRDICLNCLRDSRHPTFSFFMSTMPLCQRCPPTYFHVVESGDHYLANIFVLVRIGGDSRMMHDSPTVVQRLVGSHTLHLRSMTQHAIQRWTSLCTSHIMDAEISCRKSSILTTTLSMTRRCFHASKFLTYHCRISDCSFLAGRLV